MNLNLILALGATIVCLGLSSCTTITNYATDPDAPKSRKSATVTIETKQAAHWASGTNGSGKLRYRGRNYPFTVSAVGVGGNGVQSVDYKGDVYNLRRLSDFAGHYNGVRSGVTVGNGVVKARLKGDNGVIIYLIGESEGIANANGADSFVIKME